MRKLCNLERESMSVLNEKRISSGLIERKFEELLLFQYANELGLGKVEKALIYEVR